MEDKILFLYLYALIGDKKIAELLRSWELNQVIDKDYKDKIRKIRTAFVKITRCHIPAPSYINDFIREYIISSSIQSIYGNIDILKTNTKFYIDKSNQVLKEHNIGLYQDEIDIIVKKINKRINRVWYGPTKFQLATEKCLGFVRKVIYKMYSWRIKKILNSYLEEPLVVKVRKVFKVMG